MTMIITLKERHVPDDQLRWRPPPSQNQWNHPLDFRSFPSSPLSSAYIFPFHSLADYGVYDKLHQRGDFEAL